ncbi:Gfo/Idh/MocA family protein [Halopelagius longus]|uniref:Gfo/Idh/MocA family oxidoreductase n=1 Tax=Halopelagius longus TaxID=1236180 RepID=A0A1H1FJT3_9EURY|nr:Gfo/Idh/MocA family oxidoreductase [Halopelagius longus]RDI70063.1 gfo/Idh/MocA family oxidoreductase [Halopelagius longus]SDR01302.1 Predicted dehydrogenase [Halopelagius longus]
MTYRAILVGTGGQGANWCSEYLPPNVEDELVDVVAAVDVDEAAHENAVEHLGVDPSDCYTDAERAFEEVDADFCAVVVPPWIHEDIVDIAIEHDVHVLTEKPIADSLEASVRIAEKIERAGLKMGVTMSHRFDRDKTTLRRRLRSGETGPIDYFVGRLTCNARSYGTWGAFRHEMEDVLLVDGAVHQLDYIADMAESPCETIYADTWLPEWAEYEGDVQALVQLRFENGVRASWEGAKSNAATLNGWMSDYLRAECRDETLVLDDREITRYPYDAEAEGVVGGLDENAGEAVPLDEQEKWANTWLVEQFVEWLDGGEKMETNVRDNLQSMALIEAAMESSRTGDPVHVQELLEEARESVTLA